MNVLATALVIASLALAFPLVLLMAGVPVSRSGRFLRLCAGASLIGTAASVMWLMGLQSRAPHVLVLVDVVTVSAAVMFWTALAARRGTGVVLTVLGGSLAVSSVGIASLVLARPEAVAWKCAILALICITGAFSLRGQDGPRWFMRTMAAALWLCATFSAMRSLAYIAHLDTTLAGAWVFDPTTATIVNSAAFAVLIGSVLLLHLPAIRDSASKWTRVSVDD